MQSWSTTVCVAGGGPAGVMLGLLLARAGIEVVVLEKHGDFFRDFRGDTLHPSTLDVLDQLGLSERLEQIEHTSVTTLDVVVKGVRVTPVDFGHLRRGARRLVLMPQWDLLDLLASAGRELPNFRLVMAAEATDLLREGGRVRGVRATTLDGTVDVQAELTVAADGRSSRLREVSGVAVDDFGVPIDVLWFRLPRPRENPPDTLAYLTDTNVVVTIPRAGYYQAAMLIPKGAYPEIKQQGLAAFCAAVVETVPFLAPSVEALTDFDDVKQLSVRINRARRWHQPGLLLIGDAAHAMSPAFGVGINYAIQDAVAAANLLVAPLRDGTLTERDLARVQRRREPPVRLMQALQRRLHAAVARPGGAAKLPPPQRLGWILAAVSPLLRPLSARLVGRGLRPERVSAELLAPASAQR